MAHIHKKEVKTEYAYLHSDSDFVDFIKEFKSQVLRYLVKKDHSEWLDRLEYALQDMEEVWNYQQKRVEKLNDQIDKLKKQYESACNEFEAFAAAEGYHGIAVGEVMDDDKVMLTGCQGTMYAIESENKKLKDLLVWSISPQPPIGRDIHKKISEIVNAR